MADFNVEAAKKAGYTDDEILSHLTQTRKFDVAAAEKAGYSKGDMIAHLAGSAGDVEKPSAMDYVNRGLGSVNRALDFMNPVSLAKGIGSAIASPIETLKGIGAAQDVARGKAVESFKKGDYMEAARHGLNYLVPFAGPGLDKAGDKAESGDFQGAIEDTVNTTGAAMVPLPLGKLPAKVAAGLKAGSKSKAVQSMVKFAQERAFPLDMATTSDNALVRGGQQIAGSTIGGAIPAAVAKGEQSSALRRISGELMDEVHPSEMTPANAGRSLDSGLSKLSAGIAKESATAYAALAKIEAHPKNLEAVQIGTKQQPVLNVQGRPIPGQFETVPVTEKIPMPIDLREIKAWAADVLGPLEQRWTAADPGAAKNIAQQVKSLKSIVEGPDFKAASIAEKDLGNLKALARNSDSVTESTMRGSQAVDRLQGSIDAKVAGAGPEAIAALKEGREKWAAHSEVEGVMDGLRAEPVQAFGQTKFKKDSGIEFFKSIAKHAPNELPKLGRAFLEDVFEKASSDPNFRGGLGMETAWKNLGKETKDLMFKHPAMVQNLDNFFLLAKRTQELANTSGTAPVQVAGQTFNALGGIAAGVSGGAVGGLVEYAVGQLGVAGITKLMYSPKFVAAMNNGLKIPARAPAQALAFQNLIRMGKQQLEASEPSDRSLQTLQPALAPAQ